MKRLVLFCTLLALMVPATAQPQVSRHDSPEWWQNVSKQTVKLLDSPIASVRAQALKNSIYLATYHVDQISLDNAVRPIIKLYERDEDPSVRKLALAALEAISNGRARSYIAANVPKEAARETHELIATVLGEYAYSVRPGSSL